MIEDRNLSGGPGPAVDPAKMTAFVEFKIKHNAVRQDVIQQLIGKGLGHAQATSLYDSVETRLALAEVSGSKTPLALALAVGGALFGALIGVFVWDDFLTEALRPGGYVLVGVLAGTGAALGSWGRKGKSYQIAAAAFTIVALGFGIYNACEFNHTGFVTTLKGLDPFDPYSKACMKKNLFEHYDLAWAVVGLVASWVIAGKSFIKKSWR